MKKEGKLGEETKVVLDQMKEVGIGILGQVPFQSEKTEGPGGCSGGWDGRARVPAWPGSAV